jgi:hypothetical protein
MYGGQSFFRFADTDVLLPFSYRTEALTSKSEEYSLFPFVNGFVTRFHGKPSGYLNDRWNSRNSSQQATQETIVLSRRAFTYFCGRHAERALKF